MKRSYLFLLPILCLTACATATGSAYQPAKPSAGQAKVIVYRTALPLRTITVTIDGAKCDMPPNSYFAMNVKPNTPINVTADMWDAVHPTKEVITIPSGSAKHLRLSNRSSAGALIALGGIIGNAASSEGIFVFHEGAVDEAVKTREACK